MNTRPRVVVIGLDASDQPRGLEVAARVADLAFAGTAESLGREIEDVDAILAWSAARELLPQAWPDATRLRWIQAASDGVDWLLFPELVDSDVVVTNARGVFDAAIGEYVLGLVIAFAKGFAGTLEAAGRHEWRPRATELVAGRRMLVVGVGPVGRAIARAARAVGMEVRGLGRNARPGRGALSTIHGADELAEAVGWADFVVNALPSTPGTRRLFDEAIFAAMQPNARFVNIGRGATVDEAALIGRSANGGSPGRPSTSSRRSLCPRTTRSGACRTSSSRLTCRVTSPGGGRRSSSSSWRTWVGSWPGSRSRTSSTSCWGIRPAPSRNARDRLGGGWATSRSRSEACGSPTGRSRPSAVSTS